MSASYIQNFITHARDILRKNMEASDQCIYLLYDRQSPLAIILAHAYQMVLKEFPRTHAREFVSPPAPLYRGGLINPKNPHVTKEKRVMSDFNLRENAERGLDHQASEQATLEVELQKAKDDAEIESIKHDLISLPAGSIVVLVQSSNFRLSTFRIRLELFNRGVHVVEHNHLSYIPDEQIETFMDAHKYRTPQYITEYERISNILSNTDGISIISQNGDKLTTGTLEPIRGNTGNYSSVENKGGTFPLGEVFTEACILKSVSGKIWVDTFPGVDFLIRQVAPFCLHIEQGRVVNTQNFPPEFQSLYDMVASQEGEVMVREIGFGLNPAISSDYPLQDVNFHERKHGIHLSLGKKHGIYGKKLPKDMLQRYHIDVFAHLDRVETLEGVVFFHQDTHITDI